MIELSNMKDMQKCTCLHIVGNFDVKWAFNHWPAAATAAAVLFVLLVSLFSLTQSRDSLWDFETIFVILPICYINSFYSHFPVPDY